MKGSGFKSLAVLIFCHTTHHWLSHRPLMSGVETLTVNMQPSVMKQLDKVAAPLEQTLLC